MSTFVVLVFRKYFPFSVQWQWHGRKQVTLSFPSPFPAAAVPPPMLCAQFWARCMGGSHENARDSDSAAQGPPTMSSLSGFVGGQVKEYEELSPVFAQFLDVVQNVVAQFPTAFEFTEDLLGFVAEHACRYVCRPFHHARFHVFVLGGARSGGLLSGAVGRGDSSMRKVIEEDKGMTDDGNYPFFVSQRFSVTFCGVLLPRGGSGFIDFHGAGVSAVDPLLFFFLFVVHTVCSVRAAIEDSLHDASHEPYRKAIV